MENGKPTIKISVRELCEAALRSGDLTTGGFDSSKMLAGGIAHRVLQREGGASYQAEISVSRTYDVDFAVLAISGRMDGLIAGPADGTVIIDEIKTISGGIDGIQENDNPVFWGQAKCYAFIYASEKELKEISVQLTYYSHLTRETKKFLKIYGLNELETFFNKLIAFYAGRLAAINDWRIIRNSSINQLTFPFGSYRRGQREMAVFIYKALKSGTTVFAEAPTGTGKTAAALFPSIKALNSLTGSKIFYLTAKNITRGIAESAINIMRSGGLKIKSLTITAKDKACPRETRECDPLICPLAAGYYDRLNAAIDEIYRLDEFNYNTITFYARKHSICPFEFSLDLSLLADIIICDYNYLFDPRVYLRRYFEDGPGEYYFLIDEAHNLVDRAREMYSAELSGQKIINIRKLFKKNAPKLYKKFAKIIKIFKIINTEFKGNEEFIHKQPLPEELTAAAEELSDSMRTHFSTVKDKKDISPEALELFFDLLAFIRIAELYTSTHVSCYYKHGNSARVRLNCIDPAPHLARAVKSGRAAAFFSATLSPLDYFIKTLGGGPKTPYIKLPSPFPPENLCIACDLSVQTRYTMRDKSYAPIAALIKEITAAKHGNYLIFFPSYAYLNRVLEELNASPPAEYKIIAQQAAMQEHEREKFLNHFNESTESTEIFNGIIDNPKQGVIGMAVMGGVFGEGIDLCGERLSGAVIVGVGLPQISHERELISAYFESKNLCGFDYAYVYPGINRVLQAAGRVIRTTTDRGVVLLIDSRFGENKYKKLLPAHWNQQIIHTTDIHKLTNALKNFWRK